MRVSKGLRMRIRTDDDDDDDDDDDENEDQDQDHIRIGISMRIRWRGGGGGGGGGVYSSGNGGFFTWPAFCQRSTTTSLRLGGGRISCGKSRRSGPALVFWKKQRRGRFSADPNIRQHRYGRSPDFVGKQCLGWIGMMGGWFLRPLLVMRLQADTGCEHETCIEEHRTAVSKLAVTVTQVHQIAIYCIYIIA